MAKFELYDLEADVGEKTDVSATRPEVYGDFRDSYLEWFAEATR